MRTHYIPKLLLRKFGTGEKINTYDFASQTFKTKKLKDTFVENDLFDPELEYAFASKLEGPMGNLLNNKLLGTRKIIIDRTENMLMRKFLMINFLRAPINKATWEEMVEKMDLREHPSVQKMEFLHKHFPEYKKFLDSVVPSKASYISDLKMAMEFDTLEDILNPLNADKISNTLLSGANLAVLSTIAFWDCEGTGQEFIMPKLQGISMMDDRGSLYKFSIMQSRKKEIEEKGIGKDLLKIETGNQWESKRKYLQECYMKEIDRLVYGSLLDSDNFRIYPISPTRVLVCFSPYFRAFFSVKDPTNSVELLPPLLQKEQFSRHFFKPMRMELFRPCENVINKSYMYSVKSITTEEVMEINAMLLDMETEEFAFHDYNKIRDSFWYYDNKAQFALRKKHNFSHMG